MKVKLLRPLEVDDDLDQPVSVNRASDLTEQDHV